MSERTRGQKVEQWLTNLKVVITLWATLGISTIYGTSDTVRGWVHDSPLTTKAITPDVNPENYDRVIKELIEQGKKQDKEIAALQEWHN